MRKYILKRIEEIRKETNNFEGWSVEVKGKNIADAKLDKLDSQFLVNVFEVISILNYDRKKLLIQT